MKKKSRQYFAWISPYPGFKQGDNLAPANSHLHCITVDFDRDTLIRMARYPVFVLSEDQVDEFLRHEAEHWSWKKTGHHSQPEMFDRDHYDRLLVALKEELAKSGKLDFEKINAGVTI